jgi:hypothetical protein
VPENYYFGGGVGETYLSPVVIVALLAAIVSVLLLPRKYVVIPFLLVTFLVPPGQVVIVGGLHFFVFRIVILIGCLRLLKATFSGEGDVPTARAKGIDAIFLLWALSCATCFILLHQQGQAVIKEFAYLLDTLGGFSLLRFLIRDEDDIRRTIKTFGVIAIIIAMCMLNEHSRQQNLFGYIGGPSISPQIREGKIRAQGSFAHPILAGVFGGTLMPLLIWLWRREKGKLTAGLGMLGATVMVLTSNSSTPLLAWAAGVGGLCLWPTRRRMRAIRWGIVFTILGLAVAMKAPVWFLIARVDLAGGSSGYHRAMLVDQFIYRFGDWWLLGANNMQDWGLDMWDVQNEFVAQGLTGGLAAFIFFIMMICRSFGALGKVRKMVEGNREEEWLMWVLGSVMFAHIVAYFGSDYFDQTRIWWYATVALIVAATAPVLSTSTQSMKPGIVCSPGKNTAIWQENSLQIGWDDR